MSDTTNEWIQYQKSIEYKRKINLYQTVNDNEAFYSGNQWGNVKANGLPTPVFNIFKRCINYFISAILSQRVKATFIPENIGDDSENPTDQYIKEKFATVSKYSETLWERLKMDSNVRSALLDAAISGDMVGHSFFDMGIDTGQAVEGVPIKGDINFELIDNVNVHFGNPNESRVDKQPWIIVSYRALVSDLREEARANGVPESKVILITADQDTQEQSGNMAKIELDSDGEDGKCLGLIKYRWDKKTGNIFYKKSTKAVAITEEINMGTTKYPSNIANWDKRKNCYHGVAVGTNLIPNQVFINKMFAMVMLNLMNVAFPKAIYNRGIIPSWSNQVGQAIGVDSADDINKVAKYLEPGNMSNQVMAVIDAAINYTKDLVGATDAALGDIRPENHSAIIAVQQAASIPLENIKANLYQWVEDLYGIWLDMMIAKYGERNITITEGDKKVVIPFNFNELKGVKYRVKIDVGPSSYWSEIAAVQTLDNLLQNEKIDFIQYLDRIPNGIIPKKEELIAEIKQQMANPPTPVPPDPNINISFTDLPIAAQIQFAKKFGVELTEQDYIGHIATQQVDREHQAGLDQESQILQAKLSQLQSGGVAE